MPFKNTESAAADRPSRSFRVKAKRDDFSMPKGLSEHQVTDIGGVGFMRKPARRFIDDNPKNT